MNGRYKAYGEYKDSNIEFLGNIPTNWHAGKIKSMLSLKRELVGSKSSAFQLLSLTLKGIIHRDISSGEGKIPASFETYQFVEKGDLVFCLFDIDETPRTVGISSQNGMITGAYNIYRNTESCVPNYAYYYFLHIDSFKGLKPFYTGLRKVVRTETFANIEMFCPSLLEQTQIAAFLDHETAKIDTLIDKQQQLIELLKEKRQAVISHAVSKGLDPDVPMKDSGVEWLGEVPEHWKITSTKYVAILNPNKSELKIKNMLSLCSFVSMEKIKLDSLVLDEDKTMIEVFNGYTYFRNDDVLMAKVTPCFENKNMVIAKNLTNGIGFGTSEIYVLRCKSNLNKEYFLYRIQEDNFMEMAIAAMTGAGGLKRVPAEMLNSYLFAMPQYHEQAKIADFLDIKISKINEMLGLQQEQIELLKERRTALISAAVTGKIDVRDWQVPVTQTESDEVMA